MESKELVTQWFQAWESGDYLDIPVADHFKHTSPYGSILGKDSYMSLVEANRDKFLGNHIELHDEMYDQNKACVRYTISKGDFSMEVCEWFYVGEHSIQQIVSYYNIEGEINDDRKLTGL